jgi:hypothetical protein
MNKIPDLRNATVISAKLRLEQEVQYDPALILLADEIVLEKDGIRYKVRSYSSTMIVDEI